MQSVAAGQCDPGRSRGDRLHFVFQAALCAAGPSATLLVALTLGALLAAPLQASEKSAAALQWHARGIAPAPAAPVPTALPRPVRSATVRADQPRADRTDLQWTNRGMARAPTRAKPRPVILPVSGYEDAAPSPADPDAHRDPFYVADQRAKDSLPPESVDELPIPEANTPAPEPANELPLADSAAPLAAESTGELPLPNSGGTRAEAASQFPDDEPQQLRSEESKLFGDDNDLPMHPDDQLPIPSGDLSRGMATVPGGAGCRGYAEQCRVALKELQTRDITTVVVGVVIEGTEGDDFPCDCKLGRDFDAANYVARDFSPTLFTWKASGLCHKPLYFEDVQLERYGHSWNPIIQPFMSGAHFFVSVPLLPYKMGLKPPHECVYTLGYYRPGNCAPYMFEPIPLSLRAAVFEGFGAAAFAFWFWPPN